MTFDSQCWLLHVGSDLFVLKTVQQMSWHSSFVSIRHAKHNIFVTLSLEEQELLTLPEHLSSPPVFSWIHVSRSLVLYVCFVDRCLSFCTFYFGHCVVCSSSIYGFWLPLWYLQTLLSALVIYSGAGFIISNMNIGMYPSLDVTLIRLKKQPHSLLVSSQRNSLCIDIALDNN